MHSVSTATLTKCPRPACQLNCPSTPCVRDYVAAYVVVARSAYGASGQQRVGFIIRAQWLRRLEPMQIVAEKACGRVYVILSPGSKSLWPRVTLSRLGRCYVGRFSKADLLLCGAKVSSRPRPVAHQAIGDHRLNAHCGSSAAQWQGHQIGSHSVGTSGGYQHRTALKHLLMQLVWSLYGTIVGNDCSRPSAVIRVFSPCPQKCCNGALLAGNCWPYGPELA